MTDPPADPGPSPDAAPPPDPVPDAEPGDADPDAAAAASGTDVPGPVYYALEDWLTGYFLPMFRRTLGGEYRWCHQWWQHGEAISRLTALWHAWEVLRLQPGTGIATWYRDHLDHQLPILMGPADRSTSAAKPPTASRTKPKSCPPPTTGGTSATTSSFCPSPCPAAVMTSSSADPGAGDDNA